MKKILLITAMGGLALVAAAPPAHWTRTADVGARGGYPPCSRTVTDRCIQLYERGVATAANLELNERLGMGGAPVQVAAVAPEQPYYPDEEEHASAEPLNGPLTDGRYDPASEPTADEEFAGLDEDEGYYPGTSGGGM